MIFICIFYIGISVLRRLGVFGVPYDLCIDFNTSVLLSFPFYLGKTTKASFCFTMALFFFFGISTKTLLVNEEGQVHRECTMGTTQSSTQVTMFNQI